MAHLVVTTNEDGVAGKSSSKPEVVVAVQETVDHNNDISGGGGNGNRNRKKGYRSENGRGSRGGGHYVRERAGSGSKSNAGGYVIAPTAVNTNNTNIKTASAATPTTVVMPNPLSHPSIVRSTQPPINVNVRRCFQSHGRQWRWPECGQKEERCRCWRSSQRHERPSTSTIRQVRVT